MSQDPLKQLIHDLDQESGLGESRIRGALGMLMGFLLDCLQRGTEAKVAREHPELCALARDHRKPPGGGGLFGALLGPKAELLALGGRLSRIGVGTDMLKKLGPRVLGWLEERTSPELWQEVRTQLPTF